MFEKDWKRKSTVIQALLREPIGGTPTTDPAEWFRQRDEAGQLFFCEKLSAKMLKRNCRILKMKNVEFDEEMLVNKLNKCKECDENGN